MKAPRPLKVVHVSSVHPASDSRILEKECQSLARAGHDVTLIATGEPPRDAGLVQVVTRPRFERRLARFTFGTIWAVWRAVRLRPDVIHLHDPELLPLGLVLSFTRIKVVYDAHEDLVEQIEHKHYLGRRVRFWAAVMSRLLLGVVGTRMDAIVGATPHIAERFTKASAVSVQNFPIVTAFKPASTESLRSKRLVYVGGISEVRGIKEIIRATELLSHEGVTLHLAGPIHGSAAEVIHGAEIKGFVKYHGILDRQAVAALLASSAIGLATLHPAPNYVNGKPTKLFEYMAAGIPSIASDFPLWREMVVEPDIGLVVDPLSPTAIAAAVRELLASPEDMRRMGTNGRRWVESHRNWQSESASLVALYGTLAGR